MLTGGFLDLDAALENVSLKEAGRARHRFLRSGGAKLIKLTCCGCSLDAKDNTRLGPLGGEAPLIH